MKSSLHFKVSPKLVKYVLARLDLTWNITKIRTDFPQRSQWRSSHILAFFPLLWRVASLFSQGVFAEIPGHLSGYLDQIFSMCLILVVAPIPIRNPLWGFPDFYFAGLFRNSNQPPTWTNQPIISWDVKPLTWPPGKKGCFLKMLLHLRSFYPALLHRKKVSPVMKAGFLLHGLHKLYGESVRDAPG